MKSSLTTDYTTSGAADATYTSSMSTKEITPPPHFEGAGSTADLSGTIWYPPSRDHGKVRQAGSPMCSAEIGSHGSGTDGV